MPPSHWFLDVINNFIKKQQKNNSRSLKIKFRHVGENHNLSLEEAQALLSLKNNPHIVIKPADKGSAVVIMGRTQYVDEAMFQLNNNNYHRPLEEPIFPQTLL